MIMHEHNPTLWTAPRIPSRWISACMVLLCILACNEGLTFAQSGKQGGIVFRVDDNQPIDRWKEFAALFNRHGYHFSFALNVAISDGNQPYNQLIRDLVLQGHEFMDHSPDHRTQYFIAGDDSLLYEGLPGVDHVSHGKVCLSVGTIDTTAALGSGIVDLRGDRAVGRIPGEFNPTHGEQPLQYFLYLPELSSVYYPYAVLSGGASGDTVVLHSIWEERVWNDSRTDVRYYKVGISDVQMTLDARRQLARRTRDLCVRNGIPVPRIWIQPGGLLPRIKRGEVKEVFGNEFGYVAGASYQTTRELVAFKCYNEENSTGDKEFGMTDDLIFESTPLATTKSLIADRIARHYCVVILSHFSSDWDLFLTRVDSLLTWCRQQDVPVHSYAEWASLLYNSPQDTYENVVPALDRDLDHNGRPDGIELAPGVTVVAPTASSTSEHNAVVTQQAGLMATINALGGIEKGDLDVSAQLKGNVGASIKIVFSLPPPYRSITGLFTVSSPGWQRVVPRDNNGKPVVITIPPAVSTVSVVTQCVDAAGDTLWLRDLQIRKKVMEAIQIVSLPDTSVCEGALYEYAVRVFASFPTDSIAVSLVDAPDWLSLEPGFVISGVAPRGAGVFPVSIVARSLNGDSTFQRFPLHVRERVPLKVLSVPETTASCDAPYAYKMVVARNDGDIVYSYARSIPLWLTLDSAGILHGRTPAVEGDYPVTLEAYNQRGERVTQSFHIHTIESVLVDDFEYTTSPFNWGWVLSSGNATMQTSSDLLRPGRVGIVKTEGVDIGFVAHSGLWNRSAFSLFVRSEDDFAVYVRGKDMLGREVLLEYLPSNGLTSLSGNLVVYRIGKEYRDGRWHILERDLSADLRNAEWGSDLKEVIAFALTGALAVDSLTVDHVTAHDSNGVPPRQTLSVPSQVVLESNYPNPFNGMTHIAFSLPELASVRLRIVNLLGQTVRSLVNDSRMSKGYQTVAWGGTDDLGHPVASGVYFVLLQTSNLNGVQGAAHIRRMLLLR